LVVLSQLNRTIQKWTDHTELYKSTHTLSFNTPINSREYISTLKSANRKKTKKTSCLYRQPNQVILLAPTQPTTAAGAQAAQEKMGLVVLKHDYYHILKLPKKTKSTQREITQAFKRLARGAHSYFADEAKPADSKEKLLLVSPD
jgi:hypothetical protein